jgi:apolipoprotein N-acyltransferase
MFYYIGMWIGANENQILFSIAISFITLLILAIPLKHRREVLWNTVISVGFISYAYKIFFPTMGVMWLYTSSGTIADTYAGIFSLLAALTPIVIIKIIKTPKWKWLYSLFIVILTGTAILVAKPVAQYLNVYDEYKYTSKTITNETKNTATNFITIN